MSDFNRMKAILEGKTIDPGIHDLGTWKAEAKAKGLSVIRSSYVMKDGEAVHYAKDKNGKILGHHTSQGKFARPEGRFADTEEDLKKDVGEYNWNRMRPFDH